MEVHAHTHTPRKKWTHYFWEFLMLFLAVFCGFLAEYQLEHTIENGREKQYMQLMVADLEGDTTEMKNVLDEIAIRSAHVDSMLLLLTGHITDDAIIKSFHHTYPALNNLTFSFNDRTITQLKNSGNMRIIRDQKVNDGIIHYWNNIEKITQALNRHLSYRTTGRELETKIYDVAKLYLQNGQIDVSSGITLIPHSPEAVKQYANIIAYSGVMLGSLKSLITNQNKLAVELIELIKKQYQLE